MQNVELDNNTILEKDLFDDTVGILDIKAKINSAINCDIEMQVVDKNPTISNKMANKRGRIPPGYIDRCHGIVYN